MTGVKPVLLLILPRAFPRQMLSCRRLSAVLISTAPLRRGKMPTFLLKLTGASWKCWWISGDQVKKGAVLAIVEQEEYVWKKAQADAELSAAEADHKRFKELVTNNVVSAQKLEDVRRRLDVARAAADLARKKLTDTVLRAPFDGSVGKRLINAGEYVRTGTQAFYVVRLNPLKFKGDVPERYAPDVKTGDTVIAYPESSNAP